MAMSSSSFGGLRPSAPTPDENIYEEPQRRRDSEEWRRPGEPSICFYKDKFAFTQHTLAGSDLGLERREEEVEEGYDHLDFARTQELKPQYHSTDTLRSSPRSAQSRWCFSHPFSKLFNFCKHIYNFYVHLLSFAMHYLPPVAFVKCLQALIWWESRLHLRSADERGEPQGVDAEDDLRAGD